jgi:ABC-type Fe3+-hydroxamate transport system substrate-binding protein
MPSFSDQLGRIITLPQPPVRIISLVPSQTELLYTLGLDEAVVGITKFCVHPSSWFRTKARIGGTKAIDPTRVDALRPDLIIANKEENERPQVEALATRYPVWISDIKTLDDALDTIRGIGAVTGKTAEAGTLATEIAARFQQLPQSATPIPAAYFIWRNPWMTVGGDTFISHMLPYAGYTNVFANQDRYPSVDLTQLSGHKNLHILLSSEPYPFRQRHIDEIKEILPTATIRLVDGEFFSWYGSRLLEAPAYFRELAH